MLPTNLSGQFTTAQLANYVPAVEMPRSDSVDKEEYSRRAALTFKQAEALETLPSQLAARTISAKFRSLLFEILFNAFDTDSWEGIVSGGVVDAFRAYWVRHLHRPVDEFPDSRGDFVDHIKATCFSYPDTDVLQVLQFVVQNLPSSDACLEDLLSLPERCHLSYRIARIGRGPYVLMPIASEEAAAATAQDISTVIQHGRDGARAHLREAANKLSEGNWADAARESIAIVEATARGLSKGSSCDLKHALLQFESRGGSLHPALKRALLSLYGYTSDEKGLRHSLVDEAAANVDEPLAIFLFSSCVAFAAYLLSRG